MENAVQTMTWSPWIAGVMVAVGVLLLLFVTRRRGSPAGDPAASGLPEAPEGLERMSFAGDDELSRAVGRSGARQEHYFVGELPSGERIALGHTPRQPWVDVFVRRRLPGDPEEVPTGPYELFSYSLFEERWSYGASPAARNEVESVIRGAFSDYLASARRAGRR